MYSTISCEIHSLFIMMCQVFDPGNIRSLRRLRSGEALSECGPPDPADH